MGLVQAKERQVSKISWLFSQKPVNKPMFLVDYAEIEFRAHS